MIGGFPHLADPWWLLLLLALPLLAWHHHRRQSLGALTYSRLPLQAAPPTPAPPTTGARRGASPEPRASWAAPSSASWAESPPGGHRAAASPGAPWTPSSQGAPWTPSSQGAPWTPSSQGAPWAPAPQGSLNARSPQGAPGMAPSRSAPWAPSSQGATSPPPGAPGEPPAPAGHRKGNAWRLHLPFYLRLGALACLAVALARPQLGYAWDESLTEGIDIELVLDISGSMAAEDFQPRNRLAVAKEVVKRFIAARTGDRIGLVVFSGSAMTRAPLTTDQGVLEMLVDAVELNSLPDGTAIGVALAAAAARLQGSAAKTRVIVLVTDGGNNAGEIDPISAAAMCKGLGLKVYAVGVGTAGRVPVPVPVQDPETGRIVYRRQMMNVAVDEELLRQIARRTGGLYFKATDQHSLEGIFDSIDRLEKTPLHVKRYVRYREGFMPLALAALVLLVAPLGAAGLQVTAEP
jgi:Ca-activated chloride channel family protein